MEQRFINKRDAEKLSGFSCETLKKWRLNGKLIQGIHWIKIGDSDRVIRYNAPLLVDFLQNQDDPTAHQRAIDQYIAGLPSNQASTQGHRKNARINKSGKGFG